MLESISLVVGPETRLGVVGPNGAGKSTLLAVLAGHLAPDSGQRRLDPPSATVGLLAQEQDIATTESVGEHLARRLGISEAEAELAEAASALGGSSGAEQAAARYETALERLLALGAGDFEARLLGILDELGLGSERREQPVSTLSGGQASRLALAAMILSRFELTLLDEPTNDLDFDGLARLEQFVLRNEGGLVVVSHDRAFLERCAREVLELDEHDHRAQLYGGGWAGYLAERATARAHAEDAYALHESRRGELLERARQEREWATQGVKRERRAPRDNDKAQRGFRMNRTEKLAARARRTERAIDALEPVDKPWEGWQLRYSIGTAPRAGAVVARLDHAVVERGSFRLGPLDLEIGWGERLALTGPNGSGKSTLVAALLGRLPLCSGRREIGPSVVVGELAQDRRPRPDSVQTVLGDLVSASGLDLADARSQLAKFGLGAAEATRPLGSLSAGERTRARLAGFQAIGVNFLVLDEPTNHLDLEAIEQLEAALASFSGTLLLVSHDRRLLEAVELTRSFGLAELAPEELDRKRAGA